MRPGAVSIRVGALGEAAAGNLAAAPVCQSKLSLHPGQVPTAKAHQYCHFPDFRRHAIGSHQRWCRQTPAAPARMSRSASDANPPSDVQRSSTASHFISVPAVCAGVGDGMLTLDAIEPGDLTANDQSLLRLMAGLLADGLAR